MTRNLLRNAVLVLLIALPASAKKPKNFRMRPKPAPVEVEESTATAKEPPRVLRGRWTPEVRAALDDFLQKRGKGSPGYDATKPPVAVLPWSDALVAGDPAELVFLKMTTKVEFRFDEEWWGLIPIAYGRQPARAAYEHFIALSTAVWHDQPDYHHYRKAVLQSYLDLCRNTGRRECRQYLMRLFAGWKEKEAVEYSRVVLEEEKARPASLETVSAEEGDSAPLKIRRGLRLIVEMKDLVAKLRANGVDVWVVDDVPQPVLAASVADYGVDPSRVWGVKSSLEGARLSGGVVKPVPTRGGKAEIVKSAVGRAPDLVIGRDAADSELMSYGEGLRIALTGDPALEQTAKEKGWLVQKTLAR